jgi:hypothetical protein
MNNNILSLISQDVINDVVNELKTPELTLYNGVFKNTYNSSEHFIRISDLESTRKALLFNTPFTSANEYNNEFYNVKTYEIPIIKVKKFLPPSELRNLSKLQGEDITATISNYLFLLKKQLLQTYEILCAKAITGTIIHRLMGNGDVQIDFGTIQNYTPANTWDTPSGKPLDDINNMLEILASTTNHSDFVLVVSQSVMNALINNNQTKDYLAHTIGDKVFENGRITRIADVDIAVVRGTYTDADNFVKSIIDPNKVYLVSRTAIYKVYGPPETFDLAGPTEAYAYTSYKELDPQGLELGITARFLPVVVEAKAIVSAQVLP